MSDVRPEVRNTAVRTLFLVVSSQGGRLSADAWEEVVWQLLFPLLRSVHHMAATSSREEVKYMPFKLETSGPEDSFIKIHQLLGTFSMDWSHLRPALSKIPHSAPLYFCRVKWRSWAR